MPSKKIIEYAKNACLKSTCEHALGAVLYKGGAILRIASNEIRPMAYRRKFFSHGEPTAHAEISVINNIPRDVIEKCSMLVVRLSKTGELRSAKPCLACATALREAGIKKVFYSSYSGEILKLDFKELDGEYSKEYLVENDK